MMGKEGGGVVCSWKVRTWSESLKRQWKGELVDAGDAGEVGVYFG